MTALAAVGVASDQRDGAAEVSDIVALAGPGVQIEIAAVTAVRAGAVPGQN